MSSQQSSRNHSFSSPTSSYHSHVYASQAAQATSTWMTVIPIEDDDLTFGGKPLSDWYEEHRRRHSSESFEVAPEQEVRGRTRQRAYDPALPSHHHHHGHGHHHKHGHKHHHKKSDKK